MRVFTLLFLLLSWGAELSAQDSVWIKEDKRQYAIADASASFLGAAEYLAHYLNGERANGPITPSFVELYHKTALWYNDAGRQEIALAYIDTTLNLRTTIQGVSLTELARSEHLKGEILFQLSANRPASQWFDQGLSTLKRSMAEGDSLAKNLNRIQYFTCRSAYLATFLHDFDKAELLLDQLPVLYRKAELSGEIRESELLKRRLAEIVARGLLFQKQQKFAAAAAMYQRGLSPIFQNSREPVANVLILRGNRGYNLYQAGDFAAAEREIRATIQDWLNADLSQETVSRYLAFCYGYLMMPLRASKQYEQIDQTLAQGLHHARSISPNGKGRALGTLYTYAAMAAADQHDFSRADSLFQLATYSLTDNSELSGPAQLPGIAGNLFYGQEEIMELLEARRQAYRQSFAAGHQEGLENALLVSYKIDTLLRQSRQQLSLTASLEQFIDQEKRHYVTAVDLALQLYRNTDEDRYLRTAFHFASNQKSNLLRQYLMVPKLAENFGLPAELIAEQTELELQVLTTEKALLSANKADVLTLQRKLLGLNHTLGAMRKDIATSYPAYALALRGYPPVNVAEALSSLAEDQLVVEYFLSQDSIYAFTLAKADGLGYLVFARPESLPAMVQEVVDGGAAAGAMYDQLLASIIPEEGITRLQIIPDGILWQLPFAALRTPDNRFLIEKVAVSYAYSSSLLFDESLAQSYERKKDKYQGYGIDYLRLLKRISSPGERSAEVNRLRDIGHLPFATKEVATAAKIIGGRALLNEEATKTRFLAEAPTANIIHVSMHGLLAENPLESALVFRSEDDTKAYELLYMKEVLGTQFPVALAVLSACHTGNGSLQASEGMQSLGRAFTAAGSSSTIASSWEAKDEATHRILTDFYRHLRTGAPKDVALQSSIITFLQDGTPADRRPENWANLTLTGSIAAVSGRTPTWWILIGGLIVLGGGMWFYNRKSRPI